MFTHAKAYQMGTSLLTMVVSLLLSSAIVAALLHQYLSMKQQYQFMQNVLEESLELQLAAEQLKDSIMHAGFTPCLSLHALDSVDQRNGDKNLPAFKVASRPASLQINRMSEQFDVVTHVVTNTQLRATRVHPLSLNRAILIADCRHAEIQNLTGLSTVANSQIVTLAKPLAFHYMPPIYVGEWVQERYFIHENQHHFRSLFYQKNHTDELTSLVHTMLIDVQGRHPFFTITLGAKAEGIVHALVRG